MAAAEKHAVPSGALTVVEPKGVTKVAKNATADLKTVHTLLTDFQDQIANALPRHMTPERMIRVAMTAVSQSPDLQKCNAFSLCAAIVQASVLGLEPVSAMGEAYLIPRWNGKMQRQDCVLQIGYQGKIKLARNSGLVKSVGAAFAHENDVFIYEEGFDPKLVHKPKWDGDRGKRLGAWAAIVTKDGGLYPAIMTMAEIFEHRDKYSDNAFKKERGQYVLDKDGNRILQGAWLKSPDPMCLKTVLIKATKLAPKSIEMQVALSLEERADAGLSQRFSPDVPIGLHPDDVDDDDVIDIVPNKPLMAEPQLKPEFAEPETTPIQTATEQQLTNIQQHFERLKLDGPAQAKFLAENFEMGTLELQGAPTGVAASIIATLERLPVKNEKKK